jgi:hypothetical protein
MRRLLSFIAFAVIASSVALAAPKLETIGPCTDASVAEAVRAALSPQGYRVTFNDGSTVELWFRNQLSTLAVAAAKDSGGIYNLPESALVGVVRFAKPARDYRGQTVASGVYTLRYELQPNDGDHLGTAPTRDFVLAIPAAADTDPAASYKFEPLVELSRKTTQARHPSPWNLVSPDAKAFPSVYDDGESHIILAAKVKTDKGEMPLAIVVQGSAPQ